MFLNFKRGSRRHLCSSRSGFICWLLLLLILVAPPHALAESTVAESESVAAVDTPLTLRDALGIVLTYHADVLAQQQTSLAEQQSEGLARSQLLPNLSFSMSENLEENGKPLQGNLSATQQLLHVPYFRQWQSEKINAETAAMNTKITELDYQRQFLIAWLNRQIAADTLELIILRQKTLQEQFERTQALANAGRVTQTDVLLARAQLANVRAQWEQAKHDAKTANEQVWLFVGQPLQPMRLRAFDEITQHLPSPAPLPAWKNRIEKKNLNLQAMASQIDYVASRIGAAKGIVFPRVELRVGFGGEEGRGSIDETIGIHVSQSIYSGGEVAATLRQQQAQLSALHHSQQSLARQLRQQMRQLHGQMLATKIQLASLRESVTAAEAVLAAEIIAYNNGVRIAGDVLDAEEQVFSAHLNYRQAIYNYFISMVNLHALANDIPVEFVDDMTAAFEVIEPTEPTTE